MALEIKSNCAGVVLTGGLNTRMAGQNKAFLKIRDKAFLDIIIDVLSCCFSECLIATREPELYLNRRVKTVTDIFSVRTPLAGIHAALINMKADYAFCTSCDTPFLKPDVIQILISEIEPGVDVVVPASEEYYQPLCAVYSKQCAGLIEDQLNSEELKADRLFEKIRLKTVSYEKFRKVDSRLLSFFNVNTPEDLVHAEQSVNPLVDNHVFQD
jgi:molybdopterin-guanine dinucleotide biosynthesis protein A